MLVTFIHCTKLLFFRNIITPTTADYVNFIGWILRIRDIGHHYKALGMLFGTPNKISFLFTLAKIIWFVNYTCINLTQTVCPFRSSSNAIAYTSGLHKPSAWHYCAPFNLLATTQSFVHKLQPLALMSTIISFSATKVIMYEIQYIYEVFISSRSTSCVQEARSCFAFIYTPSSWFILGK